MSATPPDAMTSSAAPPPGLSSGAHPTASERAGRPPDETLVRRARKGRPSALALLIERYLPAVRRVCHSWLSREDAEDAVQETLARLVEHLGELRSGQNIGPWLLQVARNLCIDRLRRAGRRREGPLPSSVEGPVPDRSAAMQLSRVEDQQVIGEMLEGLGARDAEMLVAHHMNEEPLKTLAARFGLTLKSIAVALQRARRRARRVLRRP